MRCGRPSIKTFSSKTCLSNIDVSGHMTGHVTNETLKTAASEIFSCKTCLSDTDVFGHMTGHMTNHVFKIVI
jgi:hypothetical protein